MASALGVDMHNLEKKPRTHLIGVRWGYRGIMVGVSFATVAVLMEWFYGDSSAYEAGLGLGLVGLIAGLSSAFIGWASSRF